MEFSLTVATKIDDWQLIKYAEDLGYDRAWVPDSQMIWSDCYATLALAAHNTSRIKLGTGVAIPGVRLAPVTAHSIASINRIAPGRVFLGIGTGHTAMRVMGFDPMKIRDFREYLRVIKTLLTGEEVDFTLNGVTRTTRFLHLDRGFINITDPIPIYVAANGPLALRTAGEFGDGLVTVFDVRPEIMQYNKRQLQAGATKAGRTLPSNFHVTALTTAVVLQPGEQLTSDRVINECGSQVAAVLHFVYEIYKYTKNEDVVPPALKNVWSAYYDYVEKMATPPEKRYLQLHNGHCSFLMPEEHRFITPEAIRGTCIVGQPEEILDQLQQAEKAGIKEVALLPPMDYARKVLKDFSEKVISRYK
jgi:alkanesulfonate monooxygenase SsuD/methylene tetrahydromethanopterin reductase-like flavin-dependent oxidoreductase (luciferase family)